MRNVFVRILDWALNALTNLLSTIGIIGIVVWIAGQLLGVSVVLFSTGSMGPAIPAGAATVSVLTPASELHVGDVVTVPRGAGELPVSHRIVSIDSVDNQPAARALTLKGDANLAEDVHQSVVTQVPKVLFVVPGGAYALSFISDPRIMIAIGIILVFLVVRAFGLFPSLQPSLRRGAHGTPSRRSSIESAETEAITTMS
ncbi:MAG: S26 family signal peptidase [Agromyces sp.]